MRTLCVDPGGGALEGVRIVAIVALVGGILIPYVAVVIANAGRENAPRVPDTFIGHQPQPMIEAPAPVAETAAGTPPQS